MPFGRNQSDLGALPETLEPKAVVQLLEEENQGAREALAAREDAPPEVLFFIASEGSALARRAVAANPSAPAHANRLLAGDKDDDVRAELARKIGRLIPNLPPDVSGKIRALTIETLERLARDRLPRVRQILAEEIKRLDCVPLSIVRMLARDVESVSAPILEYSPLLSDADLIEIISTAQASHVLVAIAKRRPLSGSISEAIADALCIPAISALLANSTAEIRQQTLEKIIDNGSQIREWHLPLVLRNDLSERAVKRLAEFVSRSLIARLAERNGLDTKTCEHLNKQMQKRLDSDRSAAGPDPADAANEVDRLYKAGELTDSIVGSAAEDGKKDFVVASLSILGRAPAELVRRILEAGTAKPVTAVSWRAGLSMRTCFKIQTFIMRLPASELLPARGGVGFPLTEEEMRWHLDYFALEAV